MVAWELDVPLPAVPPTHVDENYRSLYSIDADGTPGNDLALRLHPNGLCVVTLAPSHAALAAACDGASGTDEGLAEQQAAQPAAAAEEERQSTAAGSGAEQQQQQAHKQETGAHACGNGPAARLALAPKLLQAEFRKGRGPLLQADTVLGRLTVGPATYVLRCCCRGLLVELNSRLEGLQGAELLRALEEGYLAILEPRAAEVAQLAARCLTEQQYRQRQGCGKAAAAAKAMGAASSDGAAPAMGLAVAAEGAAPVASAAATAGGAATTAPRTAAQVTGPLPAGTGA